MSYEIESNNVRIHARTNMDSVAVERLNYPDQGTSESLSIVMRAEGGHVFGAVPILDVVKYVLLNEPDVLELARLLLDTEAEQNNAAKEEAALSKHKEGQSFCDAFLAAFPTTPESTHLSSDGSDTWMRMIDGAPTTGEGCVVNGMPVYDHWSTDYATYDLGILRTVVEWARTQGMYGEPYDSGTLKFYRI